MLEAAVGWRQQWRQQPTGGRGGGSNRLEAEVEAATDRRQQNGGSSRGGDNRLEAGKVGAAAD